MILVNLQAGKNVFSHLKHAWWFGFHLADHIFPTFIFVMGIAIPLALHKVPVSRQLFWKITRRSLILLFLGLVMNAVPFTRPKLFATFRFTGVLPRMAIIYWVCAVLYVLIRPDRLDLPAHSRRRRNIAMYGLFPAFLLAVWTGVTYGVTVPGCPGPGWLAPPECTGAGWFDRRIWGATHNMDSAVYDPDGTLAHFTAALNCLLSIWIGQHILTSDPSNRWKRIATWAAIAIWCGLIGALLQPAIPFDRRLWTPTASLICASISLGQLACVQWLMEIRPIELMSRFEKWLVRVVLAVGKNPLLLFFASECTYEIIHGIPVAGTTLWLFIFNILCASWLPLKFDSLVWSLMWLCGVWIPIAVWMDKRGWYIKL